MKFKFNKVIEPLIIEEKSFEVNIADRKFKMKNNKYIEVDLNTMENVIFQDDDFVDSTRKLAIQIFNNYIHNK